MATCLSEPEWRQKALPDRLAHAYTNGLFVDADLTVSFMGKQHCFKVHKNILAHYSKILEKYFYGESNKCSPLLNIDPEGLEVVLKLLYNVPYSSTSNDKISILSAYHVAKTLCLRNVENKINQEIFSGTILSSITKEEFWKYIELSRILKLDDVVAALLKYAELNTEEIFNAKSFLNVTFRTLKCVINLDRLDLPEIDVLKSVMRWYKANRTEPFVNDFFRDLLACVRFRNISSKEFLGFMKENWGIMKGQDFLKIMTHLDFPISCPLPSWCQTKFRMSGSSTSSTKRKEDAYSIYLTSLLKPGYKEGNSVCLLDMFTGEKYSDVCFLIGENKIRIKAHRSVLALGSLVFEKMFYGPLADLRPEIDIETKFPEGFQTMIKYEGFQTMIRYFYDDDDRWDLFQDPQIAEMSFNAALKYGSQSLKNECLVFLSPESLKASTFWSHLDNRLQIGTNIAKKYIMQHYPKFAATNVKDILEHSTFLSATREAVIFVLKLDSLESKEIDILDSVAKWIEFDPQSRLNDTKYELLENIRFCDISPIEFLSFLRRHDRILSSDEALEILFYLNNNTSEPPKWFCKLSSRTGRKVPKFINLPLNYSEHVKSVCYPINITERLRIPQLRELKTKKN